MNILDQDKSINTTIEQPQKALLFEDVDDSKPGSNANDVKKLIWYQ